MPNDKIQKPSKMQNQHEIFPVCDSSGTTIFFNQPLNSESHTTKNPTCVTAKPCTV
uniref:Uncharacterized protein n=1 Tax=Oryza brachyantha TaxID=4533 RepID=J3MWI8_ORYBR